MESNTGLNFLEIGASNFKAAPQNKSVEKLFFYTFLFLIQLYEWPL